MKNSELAKTSRKTGAHAPPCSKKYDAVGSSMSLIGEKKRR